MIYNIRLLKFVPTKKNKNKKIKAMSTNNQSCCNGNCECEATIKGLNELLSDYQIFYQNLRGFHWNIQGEKFFELHKLFEAYYNSVNEKVDEIAERILTIGGTPLHTLADYISIAKLEVAQDLSDATSTVESTLKGLKHLIHKQHELIKLAQENGDEGTIALLGGFIGEQEKSAWMLKAYLKR